MKLTLIPGTFLPATLAFRDHLRKMYTEWACKNKYACAITFEGSNIVLDIQCENQLYNEHGVHAHKSNNHSDGKLRTVFVTVLVSSMSTDPPNLRTYNTYNGYVRDHLLRMVSHDPHEVLTEGCLPPSGKGWESEEWA